MNAKDRKNAKRLIGHFRDTNHVFQAPLQTVRNLFTVLVGPQNVEVTETHIKAKDADGHTASMVHNGTTVTINPQIHTGARRLIDNNERNLG